jgi:hypothetical protein
MRRAAPRRDVSPMVAAWRFVSETKVNEYPDTLRGLAYNRLVPSALRT